MKTAFWLVSIVFGLLLSASAEERFEDVEKAYHKALYQQHQPILKKHLRKLQAIRDDAETEGLKGLVKEIDQDIASLEKRIKKEEKALKELKNVTALHANGPRPASKSTGPRAVVVPLAKATVRGGVHYDSTLKALVGWNSLQAEVSIAVPTSSGTTYAVMMNYSTTEKGRLQIAAEDKKFLPNLKDTGGMGKRVTLKVGEFSANANKSTIKITLPIHRSKPFVQVHGLRLVPQAS